MKKQLQPKTRFGIAMMPVLFVLLIVAATNLSESKANAMNRIGFADYSDASAVYAKYCARCHGGDGRAQTAKGKQTGATDLTKSRIGSTAGIKIISNGKELMPGFKGDITAEEMQTVMELVRGFRK